MNNRLPRLCSATLGTGSSHPSAADEGPIAIGTRRELFIDPHLIERCEDAAWRLHPPPLQEIAIAFDAPREGLAS